MSKNQINLIPRDTVTIFTIKNDSLFKRIIILETEKQKDGSLKTKKVDDKIDVVTPFRYDNKMVHQNK